MIRKNALFIGILAAIATFTSVGLTASPAFADTTNGTPATNTASQTNTNSNRNGERGERDTRIHRDTNAAWKSGMIGSTTPSGMMRGRMPETFGEGMGTNKTGAKGGRGTPSMTNQSTQSLPAGNGQPVIGGKVTAVNGSSLIVTNNSNVTYTVDTANAKIVKMGKSNAASLSDIVVGDSVVIQGTVNGTTVSASSIIDRGVEATMNLTTNGTTTNANVSTNTAKVRPGFFGSIGGFFSRAFGF